jgi:hypothetical protein
MGEIRLTHPSLLTLRPQLSPDPKASAKNLSSVKREKDPFNPLSCPIGKSRIQGKLWDLMVA